MNLVILILSALAYRIGGSEWTGNDRKLRGLRVAKLAVRALPLALGVLIIGCAPLVFVLVWIITAATDSLPHGQWQGATNAAQVLMMSLVTLATTSPCAAAMIYSGDSRHAVFALIAGSLGGPATWIGNKIPVHFRIGPIGFNQGPEIGEVTRGAIRAIFIMA